MSQREKQTPQYQEAVCSSSSLDEKQKSCKQTKERVKGL